MSPEQFASIKQYVGFDEGSSDVLRSFSPVAEPHLERIVFDFYEAIQAHPQAAAVIAGGPDQVARLRCSLAQWLREVLNGPHDRAYLESHSRIGRVHVRINLPQEFMFTAMNRIRTQLLAVVVGHAAYEHGERGRVREAINQILDLELAIMLDTYREDLVEQIRIRERLATLGQLAATIAHELRNPLGTIESSLFLVRKRLDKLNVADDTIEKHYDRISSQVRECSETIDNLLDLARERPLSLRQVPAQDFLRRVVDAVSLPEALEVRIDAPGDLLLEIDAEQLATALENLVRNSVEAVDGAGQVRIGAARKANGAVIDVVDDGPGIPSDVARRIFDVLFTTKASGTGLGLALARRICEAHGGTIEVVPSTRGAHFRVVLPRAVPERTEQSGTGART